MWCIFPTVITAVFSVFTLFCSGGIHYVAASRCAGHVWSVASIDAARALSVTYIWISRVIPFHYLYGVKWSPYIKCSHYAVHEWRGAGVACHSCSHCQLHDAGLSCRLPPSASCLDENYVETVGPLIDFVSNNRPKLKSHNAPPSHSLRRGRLNQKKTDPL